MTTIPISTDGQNWQDIDLAEFHRMLADAHAPDCWIDISTLGDMRHVTLKTFRRLLAEEAGPPPMRDGRRPTELYGIPIVYED